MNSIQSLIDHHVRIIPDFPKQGIMFRDICPLLKEMPVLDKIISYFAEMLKNTEFDYVAGLESRGFLFGILLAQKINKGFIPIRKKGKLPGDKEFQTYGTEYSQDIIEMQKDAIENGSKVLIVDDLLATGGTADAGAKLIKKVGGIPIGCLFVIELVELKGREKLSTLHPELQYFIGLSC